MDGSTTTNTQTSRKRRRPSSSTMKPFKTILTTISIITFLSSTFNQSYCNTNSVHAQSTTGLRRPQHTTNNDYILDIISKRGPQHGLHSPRPRPLQDYYHTNNKSSNRRLINSPTADEHRQLSSNDTTTSNIAPTTSDNTLNTQRRAATWGEKGRDISHHEENIKRKKLNKLQAQKLKLQELRARNNKKNKKKSKPGRGGSNKKPGRGNGNKKKKSKPGRGKKNNSGGGGRSKKKSNNNNGRSKKRPSKKKPNKKKPGRSSSKKPNKPKKPNGGKNKPGSRPGSRPGKNNGGKNKPKPTQGQQGSGKEDKPDKLQATQDGKDKPDKPNSKPDNKPDKPNNKPDKDEPSFIAVKPNNKPDADSIKPQSKPQQQSSYQVVKPSKDKPSKDKPKPNDANSIKPMKPQSNLQIALAYFNITKQDYKQLNAKQKESILAMTDGQINFDEQQQQNDGYLSIGDSSDNSDSGADGQFNFGNVNSEIDNNDIMEEQTTIIKSLKWNFVQDELTDYSTILDSFEYTNTNLNWDYGNWKVIDSNIAYTKYDNGSKSLMSGINSQVYNAETNGQSIYSNITLTTNSNFDGGVITFKIKSITLQLPNEALYAEVDDVVTLAPDVISMGGSSINRNEEWKEYSIPVGNGKHTIKWVHVYNPFQLKSLPSPTDVNGKEKEIGLYMDDIRYVPYTLQEHNNAWTNGMVEMKRGGYVIASDSVEEEESSNNDDEQHWKISNDGDTVKASSSSIQEDSSSGYSYIQFELYSFNGGLLTYRIKSSTSAPHDDFAISINNINVESIFGNMLGYESHSLSIPRGKAVVTLKHRVNPGRLSSDVLRSLESGNGGDGETLLKDLNFSW